MIELPEPANVIVTETIGNIGFEEGILGWVIDAKERLLAENGQIIPQSVELVVVPAKAPTAYDLLDDWSDPVVCRNLNLACFQDSPARLHLIANNATIHRSVTSQKPMKIGLD